MTNVFGLVYRLQGEGEGQDWLFVPGLFVWEQLLDVLEVFGIERHRSSGKVHLSSEYKAVMSYMQSQPREFSADTLCEVTLSFLLDHCSFVPGL